ncbi:glycosyltransferase [Bacteroides ndongoniae]|uniref:glycosyltransferase family 4 protein n=1 Tax=Bacteroides ndongoniae TaxID=1903262 RepID=UPI0023F95E42|nr:glycosyltransferase [Bacteroides ndongoniae]
MIKILWMSPVVLSNSNNSTGSWLYSMHKLLVESKKVCVVNMTIDWSRRTGGIKHIIMDDGTEEYILPNFVHLKRNKIPLFIYLKRIENIIKVINADIIHIWGVETYFSKLVFKLKLTIPTLLEIQGLKYEYADVYRGDLTLMDSLKLLSFKDLITLGKLSLFQKEKEFRKQGYCDKIAISTFKYISTQSQWVRDVIQLYSNGIIYQTKMSIRQEFLDASFWTYPQEPCPLFYFSASSAIPYKCVQTAFKALALVKLKYPNVRLKVAGQFNFVTRWNDSGYKKYLYLLLDKLKIKDSVDFLGNLTAEEIIDIQKKCVAVIQTSFIETYSLANAEALCLGTPLISTFAGAIPELGKDRESILFYQPGDYRICAARMIELIENPELADTLSRNAVSFNRHKHNPNDVLQCQLNIYHDIMNREHI